MQEHLNDPRLRQFKTPSMTDSTGVSAGQVVSREPLLRFVAGVFPDPIAFIFNQERHLVYPLTDGERSPIAPAPSSYFPETALHYAFGNIPIDEGLVETLAKLHAKPTAEADMNSAVRNKTLGNAVALSEMLYGRWSSGDRLPDFNLDGDRGYGYLCWSQPGERPNEPEPLRTNKDAGDSYSVQLNVLP